MRKEKNVKIIAEKVKRNNYVGVMIRRVLWGAISLTIVICVLVFFLGSMRATANTTTNKYTDDYWNNLLGFKSYQDYVNPLISQDMMKKATYVLPYEEGATDEEKVRSARYFEEGRAIVVPYREKLQEATDVYNSQVSLMQMIYRAFNNDNARKKAAITNLAEEIQKNGCTMSLDEINNLIDSRTNVYQTLMDHGFKDAQNLEFGLLLNLLYRTESDPANPYSKAKQAGYSADFETWVADTAGLSDGEEMDAYSYFVEHGLYLKKSSPENFAKSLKNSYSKGEIGYEIYDTYAMDLNEYEFAKALYLDKGSDTASSIYDIMNANNSMYDAELVQSSKEAMDYNTQLISIFEDSNLLPWDDYFADVLLGFRKVMENNQFEFWLNIGLTSFKLVEKATGNEWYSNPQEDNTQTNPSIVTAQKAILNVSFSKLASKSGTYSNYEYSVSSSTNTGDELTPDYKIFIDAENNVVQVLYHMSVRGINYAYFPKDISAVRMQEILNRSAERMEQGLTQHRLVNIDSSDTTASTALKKLLNGYYVIKRADDNDNTLGYDYYEIAEKYENMSDIIKNSLYTWLYNWCGYTEEDLEIDNNEFGNETEISNPDYTVGIEYSLSDTGLNVMIPGNSIKENEEFPITTIDLLPYFTASKAGVEGYTIIPDGSGAILEHDNGRTSYPKYSKRVYSTDLTKTTYVKTNSTNDLMFPMYAVVNTGNSTGIIAEGIDCSAQLALTADVSGRVDNYNRNYFTVYLRESQKVVIGSSYYKNELVKWTNKRLESDVSLSFTPLAQDELDYSSVAQKYRSILKERYKLTENDTTTTPVVDIDVIGAYSYTEHFLGIPYTAKSCLTTTEELSEMLTTYLAMNIEHINAFYLGWRNTALKDETFSSIRVSNLIGGKRRLKALQEEYKHNVTIYPYVNFGEVNKYQESFGNFHYTTRGVDGSYVKRQEYDLNSSIYDKTKPTIQVISPRFYLTFANELAKSYEKSVGLDSLAVRELGSSLAGDYKKGSETYKTDAITNQLASLDTLTNHGINNLALYAPYDYAFGYVSDAREIPYSSTKYEILDYSIPFYQLVASGLFDYSGASVNANSEQTLTKHIMDMIQTGSNIAFTFSYDSPSALLQSNYNTYYYTLYTEWLTEVQTAYDSLNSLGIAKCRLVGHERIQNNVYEVTYQSNVQTIRIILNYQQSSVSVKGYTIPANSYILED